MVVRNLDPNYPHPNEWQQQQPPPCKRPKKNLKKKKSGAQNEEMAPPGTYFFFFDVIHFYKATLQGPLPFPPALSSHPPSSCSCSSSPLSPPLPLFAFVIKSLAIQILHDSIAEQLEGFLPNYIIRRLSASKA